MRLAATGAALAALLATLAAAHAPAEVPARLDFEPPAPGTYALPPIQQAPDGEVIDTRGRAHALAEFTRNRITLLGLVYTRCADPEGCPRATWAFSAVRTRLRELPALEAQVRLVTLSFDPVHDRAPALLEYSTRAGARRPGADWSFLTTRSKAALAPILDGLGQDLRVARGSRARPGTEEFSHTLKVFLIDTSGAVREIYSTGYLSPEMIVNDMATLDLEARQRDARR